MQPTSDSTDGFSYKETLRAHARAHTHESDHIRPRVEASEIQIESHPKRGYLHDHFDKNERSGPFQRPLAGNSGGSVFRIPDPERKICKPDSAGVQLTAFPRVTPREIGTSVPMPFRSAATSTVRPAPAPPVDSSPPVQSMEIHAQPTRIIHHHSHRRDGIPHADEAPINLASRTAKTPPPPPTKRRRPPPQWVYQFVDGAIWIAFDSRLGNFEAPGNRALQRCVDEEFHRRIAAGQNAELLAGRARKLEDQPINHVEAERLVKALGK